MPQPILIEPLSDIPIRVERLADVAPHVILLQAIPGPPGPTSLARTAMAINIDATFAPFLPGDKADLAVPFNGTIVGWQAFAWPAGNVTVDIRRTAFAAFPPGPADSITNGDPIELVGASKGEGDAASWLTGLSEGDVLRYTVLTNDTIRRLSVALFVERD